LLTLIEIIFFKLIEKDKISNWLLDLIKKRLNSKSIGTNNVLKHKIDYSIIESIIMEEKYRLGKPDSNLLAENIMFRLNELMNYESTKTD
jgi:hypothetical protein